MIQNLMLGYIGFLILDQVSRFTESEPVGIVVDFYRFSLYRSTRFFVDTVHKERWFMENFQGKLFL
jgi:hypothetical protein